MVAVNANLPFSDDYVAARNRFRESATALGWGLLRYPIAARGPTGEELTIDVAFGSGSSTDRVLVISSGLHGVEGFFGSAVQLAFLREWAGERDALRGIRSVLLHGLNPFGFAWGRRCNEENVDLNRNLLLPNQPFQGSPKGYAELDKLINPQRPPSPQEPVTLKLLIAIARHGLPALKRAVATGQYDFPKGLFYGGSQPSLTNGILSAHLNTWLGSDENRRVIHLDFHTGLGAWATYKLFIDYPLDATGRQLLDRWFGSNAIQATAATKIAYPVRGSFGQWCRSRFGNQYWYAAAEFGTYNNIRVLAGLRAENQAHHWTPPGDPSIERAKRQLVELFCPQSETWRTEVLQRSRELVRRAINGLHQTEVGP
jgi:hypothetical protein